MTDRHEHMRMLRNRAESGAADCAWAVAEIERQQAFRRELRAIIRDVGAKPYERERRVTLMVLDADLPDWRSEAP